MKRSTESENTSSEKAEKTAGRAIRLWLAMLCLSIIACFSAGPWFSFFASLQDTQAITTPWGITYFVSDPSNYLQGHEQCHYDRMVEIGALSYYLDYVFGGACEEELRCGASRLHNACTTYPLSRIPPRSEGDMIWWSDMAELIAALPDTSRSVEVDDQD